MDPKEEYPTLYAPDFFRLALAAVADNKQSAQPCGAALANLVRVYIISFGGYLFLINLRPVFRYTQSSWFANPREREMEDDMEQAVLATQILANLGLLFLGIGALWYVTVYKEKKE